MNLVVSDDVGEDRHDARLTDGRAEGVRGPAQHGHPAEPLVDTPPHLTVLVKGQPAGGVPHPAGTIQGVISQFNGPTGGLCVCLCACVYVGSGGSVQRGDGPMIKTPGASKQGEGSPPYKSPTVYRRSNLKQTIASIDVQGKVTYLPCALPTSK